MRDARLGDARLRAVEKVTLIGSRIVILLGVHGMVGAGGAALRAPEDLKILRQAVELRPFVGAETVLYEDVVPAQIPVRPVPRVRRHIAALDGAKPQFVGLALAPAHKGIQDVGIESF